MADESELVGSLRRRVGELEKETIDLKAEAKDRRLKGKKLLEENEGHKAAIAGITAERDAFRAKAESSQPELTAKVAELEATIRTGLHRKAFDKAASDAGVLSEALDDAWTLSGYKADSPEADVDAIDSAIAATKASRAYLFKPAKTLTTEAEPAKTPTKLVVPLAETRGSSSVAANVFRVTPEQYGDIRFMAQNQAKIVEARAAGNLVIG